MRATAAAMARVLEELSGVWIVNSGGWCRPSGTPNIACSPPALTRGLTNAAPRSSARILPNAGAAFSKKLVSWRVVLFRKALLQGEQLEEHISENAGESSVPRAP